MLDCNTIYMLVVRLLLVNNYVNNIASGFICMCSLMYMVHLIYIVFIHVSCQINTIWFATYATPRARRDCTPGLLLCLS